MNQTLLSWASDVFSTGMVLECVWVPIDHEPQENLADKIRKSLTQTKFRLGSLHKRNRLGTLLSSMTSLVVSSRPSSKNALLSITETLAVEVSHGNRQHGIHHEDVLQRSTMPADKHSFLPSMSRVEVPIQGSTLKCTRKEMRPLPYKGERQLQKIYLSKSGPRFPPTRELFFESNQDINRGCVSGCWSLYPFFLLS
jgi:hypothetical protein